MDGGKISSERHSSLLQQITSEFNCFFNFVKAVMQLRGRWSDAAAPGSRVQVAVIRPAK